MTTPEPEKPSSLRARLLGLLVWALARLLGMTLRLRFERFERIQQALEGGRGAILVTWHGRTLIPANVLRGRGYWALISLSRDGEIQNVIFRRFGFRTVRGSTRRGGVRAALQLTKIIREGGVLAFTPDGPRGPTRKVQAGTIFLAQRSGCPILPIGLSAWPRKLLPTWDSYLIPAPFARAAFVVGEPICVPAELSDEETTRFAETIERAINACEARAEELARGRI